MRDQNHSFFEHPGMNEVYRGLHLYTLPILEKRVSLKKKRERDLKKIYAESLRS